MNLLESLNNMQKEAVNCTDGPLLLLAGAGSGKTRVITHRIAYIIEKGCDPFNILAITFTNKAAKEMKERVMNLVGSDSVWVSTFHSLCVRILRREINKINYENSFSIYDSDDSERLIKFCIKEAGINDKQFPPKYLMSEISSQKNELISWEEYERHNATDYKLSKVAEIYKLYQKRLVAANALDFDDIIFITVKLFKERPDVLDKYQSRFQYIMVDEYQDTNTAQYQLVRLLASKYNNLCVVGDDDQSIYGWRGANIANILDFEKDFPGAKVIKLEQNYRSTQNILEAANAVISNNYGRKSKNLWTENDEGTNLFFYKATNDMEEAQFICTETSEYVKQGGRLSDMAVLYRQNSLSRSVEDALVKNNIKYRIFGGVRFYDRKEIRDVLSYLKAIYNSYDDIAFRRIINTPKRGIGDASVEKIGLYCKENEISFYDGLFVDECLAEVGARSKKITEFAQLMASFKEFEKENTVTTLIHEVLDRTGYIKELLSEATDEAAGRIENIDELINKAYEFEKQTDDKSLGAFLEEVSLIADIDSYEEGEETISLMTMHSAKGLEFKTVFIAGFEESIFPSYRSITSGDQKDLEEERRLCYVGITRAKENLFLLCANQRMQHGQIVYNSPSRFLKEIPAQILTQDTYLKRTTISTGNVKAEIKPDAKANMNMAFGGKNYKTNPMHAPRGIQLDFEVGDQVRQLKYGVGEVMEISPAGADYEVTVEFPASGTKKFMAHLSRLKKA